MEDTDRPEACGVGIRGVAMAIDSVVWFALTFAATFPIAAATGQIETTPEGTEAALEGPPAYAALLLWFTLSAGYHTLLEWRYGKTIGKYLVSIRVRAEDGSAPSLRACAVRNAVRLIDWLPGFYIVGIVAMLRSDRYARLGDRFGDTVVTRD